MWEGSEQSHLSHYKSVFKKPFFFFFFCANSSQPTFICLCKEVFAQYVVFSAHSNEVAALTSPPNGDSAEAKLMCEKGHRRASVVLKCYQRQEAVALGIEAAFCPALQAWLPRAKGATLPKI